MRRRGMRWEVDETRVALASEVFGQFLKTDDAQAVTDVVGAPVIDAASALLEGGSKDIFSECIRCVKSFLAGTPFAEFERSMYFHRYLQWKWLEAQPVTQHTFRMYRGARQGRLRRGVRVPGEPAHKPSLVRAVDVLPPVPAVEVAGGAAGDAAHVPHVPRARQGRLRRGVRVPGASDRQDVRLQETREEANKETQRRGHGADRETDPATDQLAVRGQPGVRLRD
ncbi:hypothetical protein ACJJTC_006792 [Scirpophaga incertulas]